MQSNEMSEYSVTSAGTLVDGGVLVTTEFYVEEIDTGIVQIDWETLCSGPISLVGSDHLVVSMDEARNLRDALNLVIQEGE